MDRESSVTSNRIYSGLELSGNDMRGLSQYLGAKLRSGLPLLLALTWLWLFRSTLRWLAAAMPLRPSLSGAISLLGLMLIALLPLLHGRIRGQVLATLREGPRSEPWVLAAALAIAVCAQISERILGVHTLTALLFIVGSYVLMRLYLTPARWRRGVPLLVLVLILLPVPARDHLDSLIGFPARVATARFVHNLLTSLHIRAVSAEAIIVLENGIAHVDLPCSGVKGLWTGMLFFFAATWLLQRRMDLRWLLTGALLALLLLVANTVRVAALVLLLFVANQPQLAEILHVPLGALGFVGSCALGLLLLRAGGSAAVAPMGSAPDSSGPRPVLSVKAMLAFTLTLLALSCIPRSHAPAPPRPIAKSPLQLPSSLALTPLQLTANEQSLIFDHDGVLARKWQFQSRTEPALSGSLLVVESRSFRAHHAPEVCLAAGGLKVHEMRRIELPAPVAFPLRVISAENTQTQQRHTAFYWFQSAHETSDSLLVRTLSSFSLDRHRRQEPWALVTVLFDSPPAASDLSASVQELLNGIHNSVDTHLQGASR